MASKIVLPSSADVVSVPRAVAEQVREPTIFVEGVRLFGDACSVVERAVASGASAALCLDADLREGAPLRLDLAPALREMQRSPDLLAGFCAALQDYMLTVTEGGEPSTQPYREANLASVFGRPSAGALQRAEGSASADDGGGDRRAAASRGRA